MNQYIDDIHSPEDLRKLPESSLPQVCREIREFLLQSVSRSGGHLASNLGTVELTVAMHYVYESPKDKICWDVGHQTYVHKILTGRKEALASVRKTGGISGFPKISESPHDHYNTGHAGTSISQAFGEAVARDILHPPEQGKGSAYSVLAVIGDASIVAGMAFEAMNHAGFLRTPFLVVLNDNEMSISNNVGAISYRLNSLITNRMVRKWRRALFRFLHWLPVIGTVMERLFLRFSSSMKSMLTDHQFFEELGFRYLGPMDGHDVLQLVKIFRRLKSLDEPTLLHVVTRKGKGYDPAEKDPIRYHGVTPFVPADGISSIPAARWGFSKFVGTTLTRLAEDNTRLTVITPAMIEGSGLIEFARKFPARLFDAGIAEQHATTFAGALAKAGTDPFLCIYSTFLQRGYDQLIHDICLMNLPVRLVIDRAGCVGGDGETHQGLYDIAYMAALPNIKLLSAATAQDLVEMLIFMNEYNESAISVRFPRTDAVADFLPERLKEAKPDPSYNPFVPKVIRDGKDIAILCEGIMTQRGVEVAEKLSQLRISTRVIDLRCIHPLPVQELSALFAGHKAVFTIENHTRRGGVGDLLAAQMKTQLESVTYESFAFNDVPVDHGSIPDIEKEHGLDAASIYSSILALLKKNNLLDQIARSA